MIIFLYGEDTYRSRKKLIELKEKFIKEVDPAGTSLVAADGGSIDLEEFNELVFPPSLFARKRMVVIENIFLSKKQDIFKNIVELLKNKKKMDNILIFWDSLGSEEKLSKEKNDLLNFLKKADYIGRFKALTNKETAEWIKSEVRDRAGSITLSAANLLSTFLGNDLWAVSNEIDKLINYKKGQKLNLPDDKKNINIDVEDVEKLVRSGFDENIFALADAFSLKNKQAALKLLEEQIEAGVNEVYLLSMIIRQFKILFQIREGLDANHSARKITSLLKLHPYIIQKGVSQAKNFSLERLREILNKLIKIDFLVKKGLSTVRKELEIIIAKL